MKIQITQEAKKWLTVAEMPAARQLIADFKEDECLKDYCYSAVRVASNSNGNFEILKASAEIAGNCRIYDYFSEGSGRLDIWIKCYAYDQFVGFYEVHAYLSDIWQICADEKVNDEIRRHMYIQEYKQV